LIGFGSVGRAHLERLHGEAEIVAVCDPDADALAQAVALLPRPRPRLFRSEQDLLAAGLVDAVVLCTPSPLHGPQARAALDAGVHVLCEKPFVSPLASAENLVARARASGRALFVCFPLRAHGAVRFLSAVAGRIGPITRVSVTWSQPWLSRHRGTWRVRADAGGFLRDAGLPLLDVLLPLAASPVSETHAVLERAGRQAVDVRGTVGIRFQSGARADVSLVGDATHSVAWIQLFGERGMAGWWEREGVPPDLFLQTVAANGSEGGGGAAERGDPGAHGVSPDAAFVAALRSGRGFGPDTAPDLYDAGSALPAIALTERLYAEAEWR
jgi:predicted dehydrogenase